jgi:uncharacterized protein (DUF1499 family)
MIAGGPLPEHPMKTALWVALLLLATVVALFAWRSHASRQSPPPLDLVEGRLRACPASPNCVGSEASDEAHRIEALPYRARERGASELALAAALATLPRTRIHRRQGDYWHASQESALFRFIDDIELRFDDAAGVIHVRSASRVGHSDLGVNRARIEALRAAYLAQP